MGNGAFELAMEADMLQTELMCPVVLNCTCNEVHFSFRCQSVLYSLKRHFNLEIESKKYAKTRN